jgi:hypothetical protein
MHFSDSTLNYNCTEYYARNATYTLLHYRPRCIRLVFLYMQGKYSTYTFHFIKCRYIIQ